MKELRYKRDGLKGCYMNTPCPIALEKDKDGFSEGNPEYFHGVMIGSQSCHECPDFGGESNRYKIFCRGCK